MDDWRAQTQVAGSASEALTMAQSWHPDLLLWDIGMPIEDGYSLVGRLRDMDTSIATIPVIALTAYATPDDRERALTAGFQRHVSKHIERHMLVETVAALTRREP